MKRPAEMKQKESVGIREKLAPAKAALRDATSVRKTGTADTVPSPGKPPADVKPVTVRCGNCDTPIDVTDGTRPLNISCLNCGHESLLDAKDKLTLREAPESADVSSSVPRKIIIPHKSASGTGAKSSKRKIVLKRKTTSETRKSGASGRGVRGRVVEDVVKDDDGETKTVECSSCRRVHHVPSEWTQKIACTCGRWLRTKG